MDNLVSSPPTPQTAADYEAIIDQMLAEMKQLNERMAADRAKYECLKAETRQLKLETRALLAGMGVSL